MENIIQHATITGNRHCHDCSKYNYFIQPICEKQIELDKKSFENLKYNNLLINNNRYATHRYNFDNNTINEIYFQFENLVEIQYVNIYFERAFPNMIQFYNDVGQVSNMITVNNHILNYKSNCFLNTTNINTKTKKLTLQMKGYDKFHDHSIWYIEIFSNMNVNTNVNTNTNINSCVVCMENIEEKHVMIPCGHTCVCNNCHVNCAMLQKACPICRKDIIMYVKLYD